MYLHLGDDMMMEEEEIIVMIPRADAIASRDTRRAIDDAIGASRIRSTGAQKTYVISQREDRLFVTASPIESVTLLKRAEEIYTLPGV